jgi:hypothetical protein
MASSCCWRPATPRLVALMIVSPTSLCAGRSPWRSAFNIASWTAPRRPRHWCGLFVGGRVGPSQRHGGARAAPPRRRCCSPDARSTAALPARRGLALRQFVENVVLAALGSASGVWAPAIVVLLAWVAQPTVHLGCQHGAGRPARPERISQRAVSRRPRSRSNAHGAKRPPPIRSPIDRCGPRPRRGC